MTPDNEALAAELAEIEEKVRVAREERMAADRSALPAESIELAIADAERDRDARTSPEIEKLRDQTRQLWIRLEDAWRMADSNRLRIGHLAEHGIEIVGPGGFARGAALLGLLHEEEGQRESARAALDALGGPPVEVPKAVRLADVRTALGEQYAERVDAWQKLASSQSEHDARARSGSRRHESKGARRG